MSNFGKQTVPFDKNNAMPYNSADPRSQGWTPFYQQEQNRQAFNQQTYQPAINYETGILSGKTPTASSQIAAQQQASLAAANQAQANSVPGGVGAGNAAKYAQAGTATGNAGIAASQKIGSQQERAAAAGALGNMGYMSGMNALGAQNAATSRQLAPYENFSNQQNLAMSNEGEDMNNYAAGANFLGSMAGGGAVASDIRAKGDVRPQGLSAAQPRDPRAAIIDRVRNRSRR